MERNAVGWFEIPVDDMQRAIAFYEKVFGVKIEYVEMADLKMGWFPYDDKVPGSGGSLVKHYAYKPTEEGTLVYFTSPSGDLQNEQDKIEAAGGKVIIPKKLITEDIGYFAIFIDSEGNRVALHSLK
jgi:uncharacterized protein